MNSNNKLFHFKKSRGEVLRELREKKGFKSAYKFALSIYMIPSQYSRYENGKNLTARTIYNLLEHLDVSHSTYYRRVDKLTNQKLEEDEAKKSKK